MPSVCIGVTSYRVKLESGAYAHAATETYVRALIRAGATPVLLPLDVPDEMLGALLQRLDGVLFTGGGDIHPQCYGSAMHPAVNAIDEDRDRIELSLVKQAVQTGKPFMGICRGIQVINVSLGGSLYEDIQDQYPGAIKHSYFHPSPRDFLAHAVQVAADSRLAQLLASHSVSVNSIHHQAIRSLAPGLHPVATADDGIIEAVELPEHPFGLAVQWHPECLPDDPAMQRLFSGFVGAAGA